MEGHPGHGHGVVVPCVQQPFPAKECLHFREGGPGPSLWKEHLGQRPARHLELLPVTSLLEAYGPLFAAQVSKVGSKGGRLVSSVESYPTYQALEG